MWIPNKKLSECEVPNYSRAQELLCKNNFGTQDLNKNLANKLLQKQL